MMKTQVSINADGTVDGYMTVKQAADKLKVPGATIRTWIHRGRIPSLRVGSTTFIPEDAKAPTSAEDLNTATITVTKNIEKFCLLNGIPISNFEHAIGVSTGYISRCKNGEEGVVY